MNDLNGKYGIVFLSAKTLNVYSFFSAYVSNRGVSINEDFTVYITFPMYFVAALIIGICALIYFILALKNKDRRIYLYSIIYYIIIPKKKQSPKKNYFSLIKNLFLPLICLLLAI